MFTVVPLMYWVRMFTAILILDRMRMCIITPVRMFTTTLLRMFTTTPVRVFTTTPVRMFTTTPVRVFTTTPVRVFTVTPVIVFTTTLSLNSVRMFSITLRQKLRMFAVTVTVNSVRVSLTQAGVTRMFTVTTNQLMPVPLGRKGSRIGVEKQPMRGEHRCPQLNLFLH